MTADEDVERSGRIGSSRRWSWTALAVAMVVAAGGAAIVLPEAPELAVSGIESEQVVGRRDTRDLIVEISSRNAASVEVLLDGTPFQVSASENGYVADLRSLAPGEHVLDVRAEGRLPWHEAKLRRRFVVDLDGPSLFLPEQIGIVDPAQPLILKGTVEGATSVFVNDVGVQIDRGKIEAVVPAVPAEVSVRAVDESGRVDERVVTVSDKDVPPRIAPMRAVHITARDWADAAKRDAVLTMARQRLIDAVQLDIKDERGEVGYQSDVALARQIGATRSYYDPAAAIEELHGLGLRVVGRIVNFRDPILGQWARDNARTELLVMDGESANPYNSDYGDASYTNFANPVVQQYNIDLAVEAAEVGFDDILYDYVRRPDGDIASMSFPGIETRTEVAIAQFVRRTHDSLEGKGVSLGASVFGIAATRPNQIAQDIPLLLPWVDFVAPMLYPSLWNDGEYGVAHPPAQPYDIVSRAMVDFVDLARASGVAVIPWLQAYSREGQPSYGPSEIDAQIRAANEHGGHGFLLWNASSVYDAAGLISSAASADRGG